VEVHLPAMQPADMVAALKVSGGSSGRQAVVSRPGVLGEPPPGAYLQRVLAA